MENKKNQIKDKIFKKILNRIMKHFNLKFNQILFNYCGKLLRNCTTFIVIIEHATIHTI